MSLVERLGGYAYDSGKKIRLNCPYCDPHKEDNKDAYVNRRTGRFHCFHCGENSTIKKILEEFFGYENADWVTEETPARTAEALKELLRIAQCNESSAQKQNPKIEIRDFKLLAGRQTRLSKKMSAYLRKRGWSEETTEARRVGYTVKVQHLAGRIILPVFDDWDDTGMVYFQARTMQPDKEPKYVNPVANKSQILYVRPDADFSKNVVCVEGIFDTNPFPNFVGLLGKIITPNQARKLRQFSKKVTMYLDPDVPIDFISKNSLTLIEAGCHVSIAHCSGPDPATTPLEKVRTDLKEAMRISYSELLKYRISHS